MAGVFFSSPYLKGGKQAAKLTSLTKYISTREGVELLRDTDSSLPATKQHHDFISRLLKTFPDTREMPEYEDYNAGHSQKDAVEFISQVQETYAYLLDKRKNYVDYVANRPGVKKLGEHPTRPQSKLLSPPRGNCACSLHPAPVHSEPP